MTECTHKPLNLSYVAWQKEAERREAKGMRQRRCETCKLWFWLDEFGPGWSKATQPPENWYQ